MRRPAYSLDLLHTPISPPYIKQNPKPESELLEPIPNPKPKVSSQTPSQKFPNPTHFTKPSLSGARGGEVQRRGERSGRGGEADGLQGAATLFGELHIMLFFSFFFNLPFGAFVLLCLVVVFFSCSARICLKSLAACSLNPQALKL